jgi:hypothetical protein
MRRVLVVGLVCAAVGCGRLGFDEGADPAGPDPEGATFTPDPGSHPGPYRANAVRFAPGGNDFLWRGVLENTINSPRGTYSAWFHFNGGDNQLQLLSVAQVVGVGGVMRTANNKFHFLLQNCAGVPLLDMQSESEVTSLSGWVHVLASWDVVAGKADLYINDVADRAATALMVPGNICYASLKWGIGGLSAGQLDADVADLYAVLGTYIDLDVEANRRLFSDADGKPMEVGADCDRPTGASSTGCFIGDAATWPANKGTAGGFLLGGDGLTAAPSSPSD